MIMPNLLTLWITSIGDLLINNKISRKEDGNLIDGIKLNIPEYQRPYKWSAKNASQLMDDILQAKSVQLLLPYH